MGKEQSNVRLSLHIHGALLAGEYLCTGETVSIVARLSPNPAASQIEDQDAYTTRPETVARNIEWSSGAE